MLMHALIHRHKTPFTSCAGSYMLHLTPRLTIPHPNAAKRHSRLKPCSSYLYPSTVTESRMSRYLTYRSGYRTAHSRPLTTLCASLRSRYAREHVPRAISSRNSEEKERATSPQSKCVSTCHKSHRTQNSTSQMSPAKTPAQSKCASTCHQSHFARSFTGRMLLTSWSTLINHRPSHLVKEPLRANTLVWGKR